MALIAGCGGEEPPTPPDGDPACQGWGDEPVGAGQIQLPRPTGPHSVGTQLRAFTDPARGEVATADPEDVREIAVQLWYPADPCAAGEPAPYLLPAEAEARRQQGLPFEEGFEASIITHARLAVPLASEGGPHPVLLLSHGFGMLRADYTAVLEDLASHGFVVAAISHTYDSAVTAFPDGHAVPFQPAVPVPGGNATPAEIEAYVAAMNEHVTVWVEDARFVLDQLEALGDDDPDGLLTGRLDLERVGMLGHSYGGATAAEVCALDPRFDAGMNMDGTFSSPAPEPRSLEQPFFIMLAEGHRSMDPTIDGLYSRLQGPGYVAEIAGSAHLTFTDLPVLVDHFLGDILEEQLGSIEPDRAMEIMTSYTRAFFQEHVRGEPAPLLDGPAAELPEVTFEAKP